MAWFCKLCFYILMAILAIEIARAPYLIFYFMLAVFLLKIAMNVYMSVFILLVSFGLIKHKGHISLALPGAEIILIPALILSAFFSGIEAWWGRPLTLLPFSLAATAVSYLLGIIPAELLFRRRKRKQKPGDD